MKENNILQSKSFEFAVAIIKLSKQLQEEKEFVLSKQILRSGTSIGAMVEEAIGGHSPKDFYYKLGIAYKEARETKYWIRLLKETDYLCTKDSQKYLAKVEELLKIIGSIQRTMRNKRN